LTIGRTSAAPEGAVTHANSAAPAIVLASNLHHFSTHRVIDGTSEPETLEEKLSLNGGKPASAAVARLCRNSAVVLESI